MQKHCLVSLVIGGYSITACGTKAESEGRASGIKAPLATVQPASEGALLGLWTICQPMLPSDEEDGVPAPNIKSVLQEISFDAQGQGRSLLKFHADANCEVAFTREDIQAYFLVWKAWMESKGGSKVPGSALDLLIQEFSPRESFFTWRVADPDAVEGPLDFIDKASGRAIYSSYRISGSLLQIAEGCDDEDVARGNCEVITGDRPDNRATEFNVFYFKSQER